MIIVKSYACISDARIRKILYALKNSKKSVLYSGSFQCEDPNDFKYSGIEYNIIKRKKSIINLVKSSFLDFFKLAKLKKDDSIYFIDEHIPLILLPVLFYLKFRNVKLIIDLFDSFYLKTNKNYFIKILLRITYIPFTSIIVTDNNRAKLMSELNITKKITIIENFPYFTNVPKKKEKTFPVKLFFYGSLSHSRGWPFVKQFFNHPDFKVYLAGWNYLDIDSKQLPSNFTFMGLLNQSEIIDFMHNEIDWVFCLYAPICENNINASPNKVYDAIHTGCGTIINSEVILSNFVRKENLGIVINNYDDNINLYIDMLKNRKFQCFSSKEKLVAFSFDKYLDFYKTI